MTEIITNKTFLSLYGSALFPLSGSQTIDDEWEMTEFFPTKKMSTYLFAFTVSDFTSISTPYDNVEINVCFLQLIQNECDVIAVGMVLPLASVTIIFAISLDVSTAVFFPGI